MIPIFSDCPDLPIDLWSSEIRDHSRHIDSILHGWLVGSWRWSCCQCSIYLILLPIVNRKAQPPLPRYCLRILKKRYASSSSPSPDRKRSMITIPFDSTSLLLIPMIPLLTTPPRGEQSRRIRLPPTNHFNINLSPHNWRRVSWIGWHSGSRNEHGRAFWAFVWIAFRGI